MLIKLIKYDIISDYKKMGIVYIALLITSVIIKIFDTFFKELEQTPVGNILNIVLGLIFVAILFVMFIMVMIISIYGFYKKIVRDEGYLMHTLPVRTWQLILSKLLTTYIWYIITLIVSYLGFSILIGQLNWFSELVNVMKSSMNESFAAGFQAGYSSTGANNIIPLQDIDLSAMINSIMLYFVGLIILSPFAFMSQIYFSFSIGNLFNKSKVGMSVIAFFGTYIVTQTVSFISMIISVTITIPKISDINLITSSTFNSFGNMYTASLICYIILAVIFYASSNIIFTKKLNLE